MTGFTSIVIDFQQRNSTPLVTQTVTFEGCIFQDINYGPNSVPKIVQWYQPNQPESTSLALDYPDLTTLVMVTTPANKVIFRDCTFRSNRAVGTVR